MYGVAVKWLGWAAARPAGIAQRPKQMENFYFSVISMEIHSLCKEELGRAAFKYFEFSPTLDFQSKD